MEVSEFPGPAARLLNSLHTVRDAKERGTYCELNLLLLAAWLSCSVYKEL